jgi:hypothetical protein
MKIMLLGTAILVLAGIANAAPVVYTDEALYRADLALLGFSNISESFEDDIVWADSRNSIASPGSTPSVISQGIVWTSNYTQNNIATGTVGGAPDGSFAIYSLPHGMTTDSGLYCDSAEDPSIPIECYQNDGLRVQSVAGDTLYAFGGRIDTANSGKVTFLLDGVDINGNDTDNIDNWQREGNWADNWAFVGVIDTNGFQSAELRELRGKDAQQVLLFADDFSIGVTPITTEPNKEILIQLEEPADNSIVTGVGNLRGWAIGPEGVDRVQYYIDGMLKKVIPYGGSRPDVEIAHPGYPDAPFWGFAASYAYGLQTPGTHTITVRAIAASGNYNEVTNTFDVTAFHKGYFPNPEDMDISSSSCSQNGTSILLNNTKMEGTPYDVKLEWQVPSQQFGIVDIQ